MKSFKLLYLGIVLISLNSSESFAWGRKGHAMVAELAFKNLSQSAQQAVTRYLDGVSVSDAGSWMDEQRSDKSLDYLKPLHYLNLEKGEVYDRNSVNDILFEIKRIQSEFEKINSLSDEAIKLNLLEIFHLIGDLHQPFHVGYGVDYGGNQYQVQFDGHGSNLHKVWDSEIINYKNISLSDIESIALNEKNKPIDIYQWFNGSRIYMDRIYPAGHEIDEKYINENALVIQSQLALAGIRLSNLLEKYFKGFNRVPQFKKEEVQVVSISIDKINDYIGKIVKVCTTVTGTKELSSITFLNCGAAFPNAPLTAVIFKTDMANFKNNPAQFYNDKSVCITGKVELYKDKPQIVLKSESQIEVR